MLANNDKQAQQEEAYERYQEALRRSSTANGRGVE